MTCPTAQALTIGWQPIPQAPTYEAHWDGRIRNATTGHVLRPQVGGGKEGRYRKVNLGRRLQIAVHIAVASAWHGLREDTGQVVDHRDNVSARNCATNLHWVTYSWNTRQWYAVQSRLLAHGQAMGWDLEPIDNDDWAVEADRLAALGM